jgi:hypothetical protein
MAGGKENYRMHYRFRSKVLGMARCEANKMVGLKWICDCEVNTYCQWLCFLNVMLYGKIFGEIVNYLHYDFLNSTVSVYSLTCNCLVRNWYAWQIDN